MKNFFYANIKRDLDRLRIEGNLRSLPNVHHEGKWIICNGKRMVNLSSNDYLGIASQPDLVSPFCGGLKGESLLLGSGSSRLLTGNYTIYERVERYLAERYCARAALFFSSGYHLNSGLLPAITSVAKCLILADRLVHASIIDGIRLSRADFIRYRHLDLDHLLSLLKKRSSDYEIVIVVTESIFSMDGDVAPLSTLVELKREFKNILLYVDEAHAVGVRGNSGLGIAEEQRCIEGIDFLCGTMGKAYASEGAFVICTKESREFFINHARTLIFTTALPPLQMEWSLYTMHLAERMGEERRRIREISSFIRERIAGADTPSQSHIIPLMAGESSKALEQARLFREAGFYLLPVRPPTVPEGSSRIRVSISAAMSNEDAENFIEVCKKVRANGT